ncbi:Inactive pancreatic lipase-related protein 1 [Chionoecetes opilio]|uniref:Inactive pancreatic lipase-related protein 1 n=1 Tax=Chionoecetes opilio TaxID=41210 RepID=A0A8J4XSB7_CHIOP|nr:Inactive pancreatic lipase-related protein 1 [Chionoecetes opilio]
MNVCSNSDTPGPLLQGRILVTQVEALTAVAAAPQHAPRASLDDVRFLLWTRSNAGDEEYQVLKAGDAASLGHFNGSDPTVVMIHGFTNHGYEGWPVQAKTELLTSGSYNAISVEWGKLAVAPWYPSALNHVPQVGVLTAGLLDWLHEDAGMAAAEVQLAGHSLGAHVAGAVGKNLKTFRLPAITGLDPAGPGYYNKPATERLVKTDADFVQVIHSNAGSLLQGCVGLKHTYGHVDFFPNGGRHQPGCTIGGAWMDLLTGGCSHGKSHMYWIESIKSHATFLSRPCNDWDTYMSGGCDSCGEGCLEMGLHVDRSLTGIFFLHTNKHQPFAQGPNTTLHYDPERAVVFVTRKPVAHHAEEVEAAVARTQRHLRQRLLCVEERSRRRRALVESIRMDTERLMSIRSGGGAAHRHLQPRGPACPRREHGGWGGAALKEEREAVQREEKEILTGIFFLHTNKHQPFAQGPNTTLHYDP